LTGPEVYRLHMANRTYAPAYKIRAFFQHNLSEDLPLSLQALQGASLLVALAGRRAFEL
tara:strand:- start:341 stop:517 length:177 start_codon:yes stop_codon:yes gene_type:complete